MLIMVFQKATRVSFPHTKLAGLTLRRTVNESRVETRPCHPVVGPLLQADLPAGERAALTNAGVLPSLGVGGGLVQWILTNPFSSISRNAHSQGTLRGERAQSKPYLVIQ